MFTLQVDKYNLLALQNSIVIVFSNKSRINVRLVVINLKSGSLTFNNGHLVTEIRKLEKLQATTKKLVTEIRKFEKLQATPKN